MNKTNINKIKKFLSLALLMAISFNQVSLCMQREEEIEINEPSRTEIEETGSAENTNKNLELEKINKALEEGNEKLIELHRERKNQKESENRDKNLGSIIPILSIAFNQASLCMQTIKKLFCCCCAPEREEIVKTEKVIKTEETPRTETREIAKYANLDHEKIDLDNVCDDALKYMFEFLKLKDLKNLSLCNNDLNKLFNYYMENPASDSKRQIYVKLDLKAEDLSFFKTILKNFEDSKSFEEIKNKLEKFIGNSNRVAYLKLTNPFTDDKRIRLNKNNIANLEKTLLKYFSVNQKNKKIYLLKKYCNKDIMGIIAGSPFLISALFLLLTVNMFIPRDYKALEITVFILSFLFIRPISRIIVDKKIDNLEYDLSMTDKKREFDLQDLERRYNEAKEHKYEYGYPGKSMKDIMADIMDPEERSKLKIHLGCQNLFLDDNL